MVSLMPAEEIEEIFSNFERLKKKSAGNDSSIETRRLSLVQKQGQPNVKVFVYNKTVDLNNHLNNDSKPYYIAFFGDVAGNNATITVIPEEAGECKVLALKGNNVTVPLEQTLEYSHMAELGIADMVEIDELNPASILYNLMTRYRRDEIYTYVGPILLVLNPFKTIPGVNGDENRLRYVEIVSSPTPLQIKKTLPPHSFAISALAYQALRKEGKRQGIVISGESGAGKTESAKICMEFLTKLASMNQPAGENNIEKKILACNPILEGFGNAKTVRNDNSSRFGKYVLMYFDIHRDKVYGARTKNYLLEKSRVVMVAPNERGYHIFYFLLGGADLGTLDELGLKKSDGKASTWRDFKYLEKGGERSEDAVEEFNLVLRTMNEMLMSAEEIKAIWRCIASILHLGQIQFDSSTWDDLKTPSKAGKFKNEDQVRLVAGLLGYANAEDFSKILLQSVNVMPRETIWKPQGLADCENNRDALAKKLYDNLFNWLVLKMNKTIEPIQIRDADFQSYAKTIGLLDIFGFENFEQNKFEQFCINYVNEKLHKLYIAAIFEAEKQDLTEEGLVEVANRIEYPKTQVLEILRLMDFDEKSVKYKGIKFAQPLPGKGIFTLLEDKCVSNQAFSSKNFAKEVDDIHKVCSKEVYKQKSPAQTEKFQVVHSAQPVWYDINEFRDRNIDNIPQGLEISMCTKTDTLISNIYQGKIAGEEETKSTANEKDKTIWKKFGRQMDDLMLELGEPLIVMEQEKGKQIPANAEPCELHFIRCIKPRPKPLHEQDKPGLFVHSLTLQQITYMGVLESVDLKQKNYPFRKKFEEFYAEYELLSPRYAAVRYYMMNKHAEDFKALTLQIFDLCLLNLGKDKYAIGNTKVLMMPQIKQVLDKCIDKASAARNAKAKILKQAFCVFNGAFVLKQKMQTMRLVQDLYRWKLHKKRERRAEHFKGLFEKAIILYKADRRKIQEQKAGSRIQDVLMRHVFRNKLAYGLKARETIVKHTYNRAYINRIGKLLLCMTLQKRIVNNAFAMAKKSINERATWNIQRAIRGYMARNKEGRLDIVKKAIEEKENLRLHVSAKKIQKRLKGLLVRRRINYVHQVASRIQAYFRMRWFRQVFSNIKSNTMVLQRAVRRYMARRDMIKERMRNFLMQEYQFMENVREMEHFMLFGDEKNNQGLVREQTPYSMKKIFLFSRIVDQHVITDLSDLHSTPWSSQFMKLCKDNLANDTPIMQLSVGQSHSIACTGRGRTYVWGWNDSGQCAKDPIMKDEVIVKPGSSAQIDFKRFQKQSNLPNQSQIPVKTSQILAVEDRCIIQLQDANTDDLIVWGGNERGQLGLGHYNDVSEPTRLQFFSKQGLKVSTFAAGGNLTLAACETGESFAWPFTMQGQKVSYPVKMPFSDTIKINRVSCGYNFGFFISVQGHVYAVGKDNQDGQLGLGHVYPNDIPELVQCFKAAGERIDSIECGYRHAIARSTLGKVYSWGWNVHGQLGHGTFYSELSPRQIILERGKAIQIAAGYSHSVIMVDENKSRDVLWFGTSGSLQKQSTPVQMVLSEKLPSLFPGTTPYGYPTGQQLDFAAVKVTCTWSKTLSVTNLMMADCRAVNQVENISQISSTLARLSANWDQREVMPPYIDCIANMFSANVMRKKGNAVAKTVSGATNKGATQKSILQTVRTQPSGRSTPYKK